MRPCKAYYIPSSKCIHILEKINIGTDIMVFIISLFTCNMSEFFHNRVKKLNDKDMLQYANKLLK